MRYGAAVRPRRRAGPTRGEVVRIRSHRNVARAAVVALVALACGLVPGGGALAASNPTTTIDSGPADGSFVASGASATFTFSASGGAGAPFTFSCQLDGSTPVACDSGSFPTGALSEGPHTFTVTASDSVAAADPTPPSRTWTVDTTNPTVNITSPAANGTFSASASPSFTFSANDANLDTVQCSVDGGGFSNCTSPFSPSALGDGSHTLQVQVTDKAGNSASASRSLTVDTTDPTASITSGPANGSYAASASPSFGFTASDSNLDTVQCKVDGGGFSNCTSPFAPGPLNDGSHTVVLQATDNAGNQASDSRTWTVDTTPPSVNITSGPAANAFSATASPSFGFTATDANLDTVECQVDSGGFSACTSPYAPGPLTDGSHTIEVQATDKAGNPASVTRTWTVDTTSPVVNITSGPAANAFSATASPSFGFTATDTNLDTVQCKLDTGSYANCTTPYAPGSLADGSHTIVIQATDKAGNQASAARTWSVDTTPPTTTDNAPTGFWKQAVTVTLSPGDGTGSGVASTTYSVDNGATHTGTSVVIAAPSNHTNDGVHTIRYFSTDNVGNTESTNSVTVSIDTTAPSTTSDSPLAGPPTSPPVFPVPSTRNQAVTLTPTDAGADVTPPASTTYSVDGGAPETGTAVTLSPTIADGWHTITYHSVDNANPSGNVEATKMTYEYTDTTAPDTAITSATVGGQATFGFQVVSGSDPDDTSGFAFQCSLVAGTGSPSWSSCTSPFSQSGLQGGSYTFSVRALDGAGNADSTPATWTWTSTPGAADTTLVVPGTVTTDPGTGATSALPNVDSVLVPTVSGSAGALVANALAAASGQGTDVGIGLATPIVGVDCPSNWKCFDPKTIVFTVQQLGSVTGTPVYTFTVTVDSSLRPKKLLISGVKIFHDGVNVPNCNKPHPKTPAPGPICIAQRTQLTGGDAAGDWQFQLITTINGRVRM